MKLTVLFRKFSLFINSAAALALGTAVCSAGSGSEKLLTTDDLPVKNVIAVQEQVTPDWMAKPDVLGTAVGLDDVVGLHLIVFVDRDGKSVADTVRSFPPNLRGVAVRIEHTDKFVARAVSHKAKQATPIQLGTSGGWRNDLANGYCCGGTLGSLIQANGVQYILSNYHVLEADIVPGGNQTVAATGDPVIQPGLIDVACNANGAQNVATLVKVSSLPNNNVDCAVAKVVSGMVNTSGAILEIGTISSQTVDAALNQAVKKSGRTTGLTHSKISGLNATVSVQYENECAGGVAFTKTFSGQIVISNRGSRFLNSGDSGSLMVEDFATNPRAVGLLFAGSSSSAIANPIGQVLTFLGTRLGGTATMVGN